ncbi:MAG: DUF374 domain-containing protein [Deltaproteobacteria bacterium]|nr:DUF374 domain-containing protein [Deltaproteobacteria bacterium]
MSEAPPGVPGTPSESVGRGVPWWLRPAVEAYGLAGGTLLEGGLRLARALCTVTLEGDAPPPSAVLCYWHRDAILGFLYVLGTPTRFVALCHPAWTLKPWERLARWHRWHLIAASSGHDGQRGARAVVACLREGLSTFVCPDGPRGPPGTLHRGALHMASQAGAPLVPMRFVCSRELRLPRWDRLRLPLPGATVTVLPGRPLPVDEATLDASADALGAALGPAS